MAGFDRENLYFTGGKREKLYFGDEGEALPAALRGHHGGKPVGKTWYNML